MSRDLLKRRGSEGFRRRWSSICKDRKPGGMAVVWLMGCGVQDRGVEIREGPREATRRVQGSPEMMVAGDSDHKYLRGKKLEGEKISISSLFHKASVHHGENKHTVDTR